MLLFYMICTISHLVGTCIHTLGLGQLVQGTLGQGICFPHFYNSEETQIQIIKYENILKVQ